MSETTAAAAPPPCPAPADWIVFRGRARLWLCDGHRRGYEGRGRVCAYAVSGSDAAEPRDGETVFTGEPRSCGETA